ncbi:hypothetical protein CBLAS_0477 [Campylobacter blaseri]|uniref:hypothetical protein n=1 Tax=Campylobacter blaseri TaxID=2042961 RepID=UPI0010574A78|nr:hypothetical protein [Campylobacter blaseri]QKF85673.1 hypothetical protein CBLAS_0477 [Campylobacter blaseri]
MSKRVKFTILTIVVFLSIIVQISILLLKDYKIEEKQNLIKITSLNSFAFYTQIPYLRHSFGHSLDEIFKYHPAFRESDIGSFVNSGYAKRFIEK